MDGFNEDKETRGIKVLLTIADANQRALIETGIDAEVARKIALKAVNKLRVEHGGQQLYIPKGAILELTQRDWKIWDEFNGLNRSDLARKYKLTERSIYLIVARCREEHDRKHQMQLFE